MLSPGIVAEESVRPKYPEFEKVENERMSQRSDDSLVDGSTERPEHNSSLTQRFLATRYGVIFFPHAPHERFLS